MAQSSIVDELQTAGLEKSASEAIAKIVESKDVSASTKWQQVSKKHLNPSIPFPIHQRLFSLTYSDKYNPNNEPNYVWIPSKDEIEATNLYKLMTERKFDNLNDFFKWSDANREEFWLLITEKLNIQFHTKPASKNLKIFDLKANKEGVAKPIYYPQCKMNAADTILQGNDVRFGFNILIFRF